MPTLGASLAAVACGWLLEDWPRPLLGTGLTAATSLVLSGVVFFVIRNWLISLRDG